MMGEGAARPPQTRPRPMRSRLAQLLCVVCWLGVWLVPRASSAHAVGKSSLQLDVAGSTLGGSWRVGAADLDPVLGLDESGDRRVDADELERASPAIGEYLASRLEVAASGVACATVVSEPRLEGADLVARVEARCDALGEHDDLQLRYDLFFEHDSSHQGLLRLTRGDVTHSAVFTHRDRVEAIAARAPSTWQSASGHLLQGIWHIALGYDHLAFLLTLLLPAVLVRRAAPSGPSLSSPGAAWLPLSSPWPAWRRVLRIVTAFTLAHSITLSLAGLGAVHPPEQLIEIAIAASVVIAGLDNLIPFVGTRSYLLAFVFGLVHGFGFANALGELGLPKGHELVALFGFNLGVEFGQLAVVAVVLPLALLLRRSRRYVPWVLRGGSAAVAALALFWVIERSALGPRGLASAGTLPVPEHASASAPTPHPLARLSKRWAEKPAGDGYQPFHRARVVDQILTPALVDAHAALHPADAALPAEVRGVDAARAALEHGDPAPAIAWLQAAAAARSQRGDPAGAAQAHAARGVLLALGDARAGVEALAQALTLDPSHARASLWLATLEARFGWLERAETTLRAMGALNAGSPTSGAALRAPGPASRDEAARADALSLLGDVLAYLERWPEAEQVLQASLTSHLGRGDRASAADDYRRLGDVTLALARAREALEHYEHAIDLGRSLGDAAALAADYRNAAAVAQLLADLPVAARLYRRALEADESHGDNARAREDLVRLSQVYRQLDQLDEARACLDRALALDAALGASRNLADDLAQLGNLHQLSDQLELAEGFYTRALEVSGLHEALRADLYANLGNVHRRRGNTERAAAMYRRALADYRGAGDVGKASRVEQYLTGFTAATPAAGP
jgi:tetratricopeptide (TPR) repeat protein